MITNENMNRALHSVSTTHRPPTCEFSPCFQSRICLAEHSELACHPQIASANAVVIRVHGPICSCLDYNGALTELRLIKKGNNRHWRLLPLINSGLARHPRVPLWVEKVQAIFGAFPAAKTHSIVKYLNPWSQAGKEQVKNVWFRSREPWYVLYIRLSQILMRIPVISTIHPYVFNQKSSYLLLYPGSVDNV